MSTNTEAEQLLWSYRPTDEELDERKDRLTQLSDPLSDDFLSSQLRCYALLNNHEKSLLANFFTCIEAGEGLLSYHLIHRLYQSSTMANESLGLYAYAVTSISSSPTPLTSVIKRVTPFSAVEDADWAYYAALARIKGPIQPDLALRFITLASLVPHHHPTVVNFVRKEIAERLRFIDYNIWKVTPQLLKHSELIISSFRDADQVRAIVTPLLEQAKRKEVDMRTLKESDDVLCRVFTRAQKRYYNHGWQLLDKPEPQPASIWSKLPEEVIRRMACVADWSCYLALASTCKLYHNRMNHSAVWHHVLEAKWDLDVTCFDEIIPRNPVTAVKQILGLLELNGSWWKGMEGRAPMLEFPQALEAVWSTALNGSVAKTCTHNITETALRCFLCVIVGDTSGKLTSRLLEGGILDFIMNVIRTDTGTENSELGLGVLSLLFVRSRYTCAFVSRYMAPSITRIFALTRILLEEQTATAYGLAAAAAASHVLYPNAHSHAIPLPVMNGTTKNFSTGDFEAISKTQPGDFVAAAVEPSYASLLTAGLAANDDVDALPTVELKADKMRFNLDYFQGLQHTISAQDGAEEGEADDDLDVSVADEAHTSLALSYQSYFDELEDYAAAVADELAAKGEVDSNAEEPESSQTEEADEPSMEVDEPSERTKPKRALDAHHRSMLPTHDRLVPRFAAAEEEWQLYVIIDGADCDNVLHRGLLRMTLAVPRDEDTENNTGHLQAKGYWTIDQNDTRETIADAAASNSGNYGPVVAHRNDLGSEDSATKKVWLDEHRFELSDATINLESGMLEAILLREDGVSWKFGGSGVMLGYLGGIELLVPEEEPVMIGGFVLLKPEHAEPSAIGKIDLNAYERLAHVSLKVGALAEPSDSAFPQTWDEQPEEMAEEFEEEGATLDVHEGMRGVFNLASEFCMTSVNHACFDLITQNQADLPMDNDPDFSLTPQVLFSPDVVGEFSGSRWRATRQRYNAHVFNRLSSVRDSVCLSCRTEVGKDLESLRLFDISASYIPDAGLFLCPAVYSHVLVDPSKVLSAEKDDDWRTALTAHYKWVARLALFEVAGLPDIIAMQFTLKILSSFYEAFGHMH